MITSTSNQQVKKVSQYIRKAKARREARVFVVEGVRMFREAPEERMVQTFVSESFLRKEENRALLEGRPYEILADHVFESLSDTRTPQGILCVVRQREYAAEDLLRRENPGLVILENLQDPGNLGTIFRTAEAAGMDGIILSEDTVDIYNPKTVRATMGSIYRMPFCTTPDLPGTVKRLQQLGVRIYAAHLQGKQFYYEEDYTGGCGFLIGNEGNGLTEELTELADVRIRIPMDGQVESLNASVAAALLMYETKRQRMTAGFSVRSIL